LLSHFHYCLCCITTRVCRIIFDTSLLLVHGKYCPFFHFHSMILRIANESLLRAEKSRRETKVKDIIFFIITFKKFFIRNLFMRSVLCTSSSAWDGYHEMTKPLARSSRQITWRGRNGRYWRGEENSVPQFASYLISRIRQAFLLHGYIYLCCVLFWLKSCLCVSVSAYVAHCILWTSTWT
jgi:hypothetical protein